MLDEYAKKDKNVSTFVHLFEMIVRMKQKNLPLLLLGCLAFVLSSCFKDSQLDYDDWHGSNCLISSFKLQSDSIPGLEDVKFTIDQLNGLIYNKDSMPYGTEIIGLVVCKVDFEGIPSSIEVYQHATGDSATWNQTDSLNFSDYVRFDVYSQDEKATKRYYAQLNIHQQVPDSMEWTWSASRLLGKAVQDLKAIERNQYYWMYVRSSAGYELFSSPVTDRKTWIPVSLNGLTGKTFILSQLIEYEDVLYLPASDGSLYYSMDGRNWHLLEQTPVVKTVLGVIHGNEQGKTTSRLAAIIQEENTWRFAVMDINHQWETGDATPAEFPVSGFGISDYESMFHWRLLVVAGKDRNGRLSNTTWETMTGLSWVRLTDERKSWYERREGVMVTQYDNRLYLIGGIQSSNVPAKDIYVSNDKGISWALANDALIFLPESYKARGHASVLVDKDNFLLLFGGKENNSANVLDELWSGRINRLGFKD